MSLSRESLESAYPLAERLDAARVVVTPITDSPLECLVCDTRSDESVMREDGPGNFVPDFDMIAYLASAKDETLQASEHDTTKAAILASVGQQTQKHFAFAKTVVAPAIQALHDGVQDALTKLTPSKLLGVEIREHTPPKLLSNSTFLAQIKEHDTTPFDNPHIPARLPAKTGDELIELIKTGSASVDADAAAWLAVEGASVLQSVYNTVFHLDATTPAAAYQRGLQGLFEDRDHGTAYALAVYLLARNLIDNPPEGTEASLEAYNAQLGAFRNQAGAALSRASDAIEREVRLGSLVRRFDGLVVYVNQRVYEKWLTEGGNAEILFGNALSQRQEIMVDKINERAQEFQETWLRHVSYTRELENSQRVNAQRDLLKTVYASQLDALPAETPNLNRGEAYKRFEAMVNATSGADLKDLPRLCQRLVCRAQFDHTNAEDILADIDQIKCDNPEVTVREAAALAYIKHCARWALNMMRVERM